MNVVHKQTQFVQEQ